MKVSEELQVVLRPKWAAAARAQSEVCHVVKSSAALTQKPPQMMHAVSQLSRAEAYTTYWLMAPDVQLATS